MERNMHVPVITYDDAIDRLSWQGAVQALRTGHQLPRAQVEDIFLGPADGTMMSRGAYIPGLGYGAKTFTVFSGNAAFGLPAVQGAMMVFEPENGQLTAIVESRLITEYKTAADSVLGSLLLARTDSRCLLIVGAGTVAHSLVNAYSCLFPRLEHICVWSRRPEQAEALAQSYRHLHMKITAVTDLPAAAAEADIISTATMARQPVLHGSWVNPGTHVDLIGAFKADMREADDELITKGTLFVDSRETTIRHIGELTIPIETGVIAADDVRGDLYDLVNRIAPFRRSAAEITVYKNGGGAHLDLMVARYIDEQVESGNQLR